jgi:hypothetical protein
MLDYSIRGPLAPSYHLGFMVGLTDEVLSSSKYHNRKSNRINVSQINIILHHKILTMALTYCNIHIVTW